MPVAIPTKSSGVNLAEAQRFLEILDPDTNQFTFQTFDDLASRKLESLAGHRSGTLVDNLAWLTRMSESGAGVYVTVNRTDLQGRSKGNIQAIRAVFADCDEVSAQTVGERIAAIGFNPHLVVESSPGKWHVYWCVDRVSLTEFKAVQERIATLFGSDPAVKDIARVMRLPGFPHRKRQPHDVRIIHTCDAPNYANVEFQMALNQAIGRVLSMAQRSTIGIETGGVAMDVDVPEGGRDNALTAVAGHYANLGGPLEDAIAAAWEWNRRHCKPPLDHAVVQEKITRMYRIEAGKRKETREAAIEEINRQYFLLGNIGGRCRIGELVKGATGYGLVLSLQTQKDFELRLANRFVTVTDKDGNSSQKPLAKYWLTHKQRRQYTTVELCPPPEPLPDSVMNLWQGFTVIPKPGAWPRIKTHIKEILAGGDELSTQYITAWLAWKLQNPGGCPEAALVFPGRKGSGKGVLIRALLRIFGAHGVHISSPAHLTGRFNGHLRTCLLLFADEAHWAGDRVGEHTLKQLITEETIPIESKGIDTVMIRNRMAIMMAANADWVVPASADERRYAVFEVSNRQVGDRRYFAELYHEIANGGLAAMMHDLLTLDLHGFHPRHVPDTIGLQKQKVRSLSPLDGWILGLLEDGRLPGRRQDLAADIANTETLRDAFRAFNGDRGISDRKLIDHLKEYGCTSARTSTERRWKFLALGKLRKDWDAKYGTQKWDLNEEWAGVVIPPRPFLKTVAAE